MERKSIIGMLPFLEETELNELARKLMKSTDETFKGISIEMVLPFLEDGMVDEIFLEQVKNKKPYDKYLPFVSEKCLHQLAQLYMNDELESDFDMDSIYPFMEEQDIRDIFHQFIGKE